MHTTIGILVLEKKKKKEKQLYQVRSTAAKPQSLLLCSEVEA